MAATRTQEREEFLADIITGAIEGGTGYWAATIRYKWEGLSAAERHAVIADEEELNDYCGAFIEEHGRKVKIAELIEAKQAHEVDIEVVAKGIGKITRGEVRIREDLKQTITEASRENDAGEIDAEGADVIVQVGLFGEIVYG